MLELPEAQVFAQQLTDTVAGKRMRRYAELPPASCGKTRR